MAAETARKSKATDKSQDVDAPQDVAWSGPKLIAVGFVAFLAALSLIVWMGSRFEGCMYLDGSRPGMAIGK
jgi:hypothetical protein